MRPSSTAWVIALAAMLAGGVLAHDAAAQTVYPRLALYGSMFGDGYPLWDLSGNVNMTVIDQISRYDEVVLDANPITPYRPDVALMLRTRNPDIRLLAYVSGHNTWFASQPDSSVHYPTRYWIMVRDMQGFLYNTQGGLYGSATGQMGNVNLAKKDATGKFIVAEGLANLFWDAIVKTGIWDGVFIDNFCDNILFMEAGGEVIDYARAGYASRLAFAAGWRAASDTLAAQLRRKSGSTQILIGNCAAGTKYATFNGWMRENFPLQGGGTWYTNMYADPGGYMVDESRWRSPNGNYIYTASEGTNTPYTANNTRKVRLGLGTASLMNGYGAFGNAPRVTRNEQYMAWWYDEYAVDLNTGRSSPQMQHAGWLGQAMGPHYQMIWIGPSQDVVTNPSVETNLNGWAHATSTGSTMTRDLTTSAHGAVSMKVTVPSAGVAWSTNVSTTTSMPVTIFVQYAVTFWAKAAVPRNILVSAGYAGGGGSYSQTSVAIGTTWKRYQVVLIPNASGTAKLDLMLGGEAGDIWLDDLHFQQGVYSIYRRDFQNGIVLVNPSSASQNVVLEAPFRRILGTADPTVNNGVNSSTQTVGANDALFLIGSDRTPPAPIQDLHAAPFPGSTSQVRERQ